MVSDLETRTRRAEPWLVALAIAIVVGLQEGLLLQGIRSIGPASVPDWVALLTPVAIVGTAAMALLALRSRSWVWWLFGAGAVVLVEGHGIHLAANSIGSGRNGPTVHLWDEVIGHYLLFTGLSVVLAAIFVGLTQLPVQVRPVGWVLGVAVGVTLFNSYIEGATPILGLATGVGFLAAGWRQRETPAGRLALLTFAVPVLLLIGWGAYWRGFPEFSDLGWI